MPSSTARRIILLALAGGVLVDVVVPGNAVGVNAPLVFAALLVAAFTIAGPAGIRRMDPADAWLAPVAVCLAGLAAVRTDPWLVAADLWFAMLLALGAIGTLSGGRITRGLVPRVVELSVLLVAVTVGGGIAVLGALTASRPAGTGTPITGEAIERPRGQRFRPLVPVLRGLLVAVPIVAVFAVLFASADAVFARLAGDLFNWQLDLDVADAVERSVVVGFVAWVWAGLFALAAGMLSWLPTPAPATPAGATPAATAGRPLRLGGVEAATILVLLDVLFAAFVILQVAYLFGGRDTLATAGLTYAEYARRGFFELVEVAVLAGALVVVLDLVVGRRSRLQVAASLALLALTAIVLASAFVRLRLYQDAYGWTELRFLVVVAIGWLAAALAIVAGLLMARRTSWVLHVLGVLLLVTLGGMNVAGPQAFVAERNLERAVNPSLVPSGGRTGLDADYLELLGDEAVPPLVAAFDRLPLDDRARLAQVLVERAASLRTSPEVLGWPAWNLSRERARAALAAWEARRADALVR
jgi:hypothetical protein